MSFRKFTKNTYIIVYCFFCSLLRQSLGKAYHIYVVWCSGVHKYFTTLSLFNQFCIDICPGYISVLHGTIATTMWDNMV